MMVHYKRNEIYRLLASGVAIFLLYNLVISGHFDFILSGLFFGGRTRRSRMDTLAGCYHVYLDVGSNVGIQVRKLYEPHLFVNPVPPAAQIYDQMFGNASNRNLKEICSVGFEPNPSHRSKLGAIEKWYTDCGWPVRFFTDAAVSDHAGRAKFFTDEAYNFHEWGGSIVESNNNIRKVKGLVRLIRLSSYINNVVAKRDLGRPRDAANPPAVLMKMDIEGAEVEVMSDLILTGAIRHVNFTMMEWHWNITAAGERVDTLVDLSKGTHALASISNSFKISEFDDETYCTSKVPRPECAAAASSGGSKKDGAEEVDNYSVR